jgi:hypothetical protein
MEGSSYIAAVSLVETKPEVATEPWRKVLLDAADYIDAHGWCQNDLYSADGAVCLVGAIKASSGMPIDDSRWHDYPNTALSLGKVEKFLRTDRRGAAGWNDTPGRTAAGVTAALRECARS